jgi:hypothetical protein
MRMRLTDRRHIPRLLVTKPICVRPVWLKDGEFEDIERTENASKRGIYFRTDVPNYFVGMRVFVTLPFSPPPERSGREYFGQVIRVEKTEAEKRAVAVQFL